jgi:uncharacterized integral membrane protein
VSQFVLEALDLPRDVAVPVKAGALAPPQQPRLVPRTVTAHAAASDPCVRLRRRPSIDTEKLQDNWQPKLYIRLLLLVLLAAYAIGFVLENRKSVSLHFVVATANVSLVWLILLSLAVGFVVGILLSQLERRRRRRRTAQ